MKKSRFTDEQIIGFLKQVENEVAVKELGRKHGSCDATFYKWRGKFCWRAPWLAIKPAVSASNAS